MSYKTILVHVDDSSHTAQRTEIAIELARQFDAHLVAAATTGVSRFAFQNGPVLPADPNLAVHIEYLRARAQTALAAAEAMLKKAGIQSMDCRIVDDDTFDGIDQQARYSDLVVLGQTDTQELSATVRSGFPEYVILSSGRPVLVIPHSTRIASLGKRILIAWDGGRPATRAIADAMPLLQRAELVQLVSFNQRADVERAIQPQNDIALYLARHGVKVELLGERSSSDVGNALLSLIADQSSDLLVMGAYGHSRFREILLGGVTRTILTDMTVPVLMSH